MKTISITASEAELNSFGIEKSEMAFAEFVDTVGRELARRNLAKCVEISEKYGLSGLN